MEKRQEFFVIFVIVLCSIAIFFPISKINPTGNVVSNQCTLSGYICGEIHGSGPEASCLLLKLEYIGNPDLDLACDETTMAGCCRNNSIPIPTNLCGNSNKKTFLTKPTTNLCNDTIAMIGESTENSTAWKWVCQHQNTGQVQECYSIKDISTPTAICVQQGLSCGPNKTNIESSCNELTIGKTYSMIPYSNITYHKSCGNELTTGCCMKFCKINSSDLNLDGKIDSSDLSIFNSNNNKTNCNSSNFWCSCADMDKSGNTNLSDYDLFMKNYSISNFWTEKATISKSEFNKGHTEKLSVRERIKTTINNEIHYIGIYNLTTRRATIEVQSITQRKILEIGDIESFDIDDDDEDDLSIKLKSIRNSQAEITISPFEEETSSNKEDNSISEEDSDSENGINEINVTGEGKENNTWTYVIIIIIVLILIVGGILFYFMYKNRNQST